MWYYAEVGYFKIESYTEFLIFSYISWNDGEVLYVDFLHSCFKKQSKFSKIHQSCKSVPLESYEFHACRIYFDYWDVVFSVFLLKNLHFCVNRWRQNAPILSGINWHNTWTTLQIFCVLILFRSSEIFWNWREFEDLFYSYSFELYDLISLNSIHNKIIK